MDTLLYKKKRIYSFKQIDIIAYKLLITRLTKKYYIPIPLANLLFKYKPKKIIFSLCVDDFGIDYHSEEDLLHLHNTLAEFSNVSRYR